MVPTFTWGLVRSNFSLLIVLLYPDLEWSPDPGLNWRPHPYQGCALPTELSGLAAVRSVRPAVGAGNGIRTRDIQLGRLTLYQLSYSRLLLRSASVWLEGVGFEPTKA